MTRKLGWLQSHWEFAGLNWENNYMVALWNSIFHWCQLFFLRLMRLQVAEWWHVRRRKKGREEGLPMISWDLGVTSLLFLSHPILLIPFSSSHARSNAWLIFFVPKYGIMYENPMKLGRMMNGIQGIPRVTTQGCGFLQLEDQWMKPSLRCHIPKIAQFVLESEEGCGVWVIFFSAFRGVSLIVTSWGPQLITWSTRVFFWGITIVFMRWNISPRFT